MRSNLNSMSLTLAAPAIALLLAPYPSAPAQAEENIGVASVVRNDVTGVLVSGTVKVNVGASVFHNEVMRTAKDSSAKLVFTDSTNLAIGPNSTVKLTNFVFSGPSSYGKATINVAKGAFRFTTGHSDKGAYELNTGVATIGVRGTIFEGLVEPDETKLHVVEGIVDVRTKKGKTCEVKAGRSVRVTDTACTPISNFDAGFDSELAAIEEFHEKLSSNGLPINPVVLSPNPVGLSTIYIPSPHEGCTTPDCSSPH